MLRAKRYREKIKNTEAYKEKNKSNCRKYRKNLTGAALKRDRRMAALRMRNLRQRAKEYECLNEPSADNSQASGSGISPFSTRQSLGKAVKRVLKNLPKSPRKRKLVASKVASIAGISLPSPSTPKVHFAISQDVKKKVIDFYKRDDVSRQLPGRKDVIRVKDPQTGEKKTLNKRLMNFNLREAFTIFKDENPDAVIGVSKFCTLRPKEVGIVSSKSQEVCCCPYCENMNFLFAASRWKPSTNITQVSQLVATMVCDTENPGCMKCQCKECPYATDMSDTLIDLMADDRTELLVKQWNGGLLEVKEYTIPDLCEEIHSQMYKYLKHIYNVKTQSSRFRAQKENLVEGTIIMQTDFAENYAIKHQNEVMAAHWMPSRGESVTIYTCVVHYVHDEEHVTVSYAIISETMAHSSLEAQVFNAKIIDHLRLKSVPIDHIILWTDGAAAHFKNRYSITALTFYPELHEATGEWNFFESYHGKGPHDGIGALLKWNVYRRVLQGRATVRSAHDLFNVANELAEKTTLIYVSKDEIQGQKSLYERLWKGCRAAHSIQQCQSVKTVGHYRVALYSNTNDDIILKKCNLEPCFDIDSDDDSSTSPSYEQSNEDLTAAMTPEAAQHDTDTSFVGSHKPEDEHFNPDDSVQEPMCERTPGSYVVVKYTGKKSVHHYAALVESTETLKDGEQMIKINCLKSSGKNVYGDITFVFPKYEDKGEVQEADIVQSLPVPKIYRDTYIFEKVSFPSTIQ